LAAIKNVKQTDGGGKKIKKERKKKEEPGCT
jgi:hypothetical protein